MAGGNMKLLLTLEAKEAGVARALKQMQDNIRRTAVTAVQESEKAGRAQEGVVRRIERETRQASAARARLGIRSEREIQREIMRTQQAYTALARSGKASQNELARAAQASRQRIRELNTELGQSSKLSKAARIGVSAVAGVTAAGMVLKDPIEKRRNFDLSLAYAANTAYAERDVPGRLAGKKELYDTVKSTVTQSGGSRDEALAGLNSMIASGTVEINVAKELLPYIQKTAVASDTSTEDIAQIAISGMQQYKLTAEQIKSVLNQAMAAGQSGQFELNDMAKWLPKLMAATGNSAMGGTNDFKVLLRSLQQARITAGSSDEAGNNLVNLAMKITSQDAVNRFKKVEYKDKDGKTKGIDLPKSLMARADKGENTIDALIGIIDQYMSGNKEYQKLQTQIDQTKDNKEKNGLLQKQAKILDGTEVGQFIADQQALLALLAIRNNKEYGDRVMQDINNSDGTVDKAHDVIMDTNYAKAERKNNAKDFGQMESLEGLDNALGNVNEKLADYAARYPALGAAVSGSALAITALAAAAAAASGAIGLMSLAGVGGKGGAAGLAKGAAAAGGRFIGKGAKLAGRAAPVLAGAVGVYNAYDIEQREDLSREDKNNAQITNAGSTIGGIGGAWGGAALGAAIGSAVPVIGTVIGGAIGAALGAWAGSAGGEAAAGLITRSKAQYPAQRSADVTQSMMPPQLLQRPGAQVPALTSEKMQPMFYQQTADFQASVQQGTNQLGTRLDRINSALASQQQTIQNNISVVLDGRVVSEQVSRQQFSMFNRGAAQ